MGGSIPRKPSQKGGKTNWKKTRYTGDRTIEAPKEFRRVPHAREGKPQLSDRFKSAEIVIAAIGLLALILVGAWWWTRG